MNVRGIDYTWLENTKSSNAEWLLKEDSDVGIEKNLKALHWKNTHGDRVLSFNLNIPTVKKNVDICLFECDQTGYDAGRIVSYAEKNIMLGELKAGIDPAGADEHWKTANTALERIRNSFASSKPDIKTSFVGAAIANAMADEIFEQLNSEKMTNAANLTSNEQLTEYCNWLLNL